MDFDDEHGVKRDGGTSYIIKNSKTFYFSKIKNKFIAIFDNDAEGYQSKCTLLTEIKNWPDNFRILLYPEMKAFRKYPTLASNGTIITDDIKKKFHELRKDVEKGKENFNIQDWHKMKTLLDAIVFAFADE